MQVLIMNFRRAFSRDLVLLFGLLNTLRLCCCRVSKKIDDEFIENQVNISNVELSNNNVNRRSQTDKSKHYLRINYGSNFDARKFKDVGLKKAIEELVKDTDEIKKSINTIVSCENPDVNCYPYHIAYGNNCGGVLLSNKWALTAAHCGKNSHVRAGSKYVNQGEKIIIKNHYPHKMWMALRNQHIFDFDYQLLELNETLSFNENVAVLKIGYNEDVVPGKFVTVSGWGVKDWKGSHFNMLRSVRVPIVEKWRCQEASTVRHQGNLTSRMFCAGFETGLKDACHGDSGGPAVSNGRILGLVSFGYGCAEPNSYGIYSNVALVRSWIEDITNLKFN